MSPHSRVWIASHISSHPGRIRAGYGGSVLPQLLVAVCGSPPTLAHIQGRISSRDMGDLFFPTVLCCSEGGGSDSSVVTSVLSRVSAHVTT
ncbi:hypothetical protein J6590_066139 [Homalodisca vitripennis]|nr:hypothetical protein J6590_066139 [Homalodisca vitripennis]